MMNSNDIYKAYKWVEGLENKIIALQRTADDRIEVIGTLTGRLSQQSNRIKELESGDSENLKKQLVIEQRVSLERLNGLIKARQEIERLKKQVEEYALALAAESVKVLNEKTRADNAEMNLHNLNVSVKRALVDHSAK